jgi:hypothetical protein
MKKVNKSRLKTLEEQHRETDDLIDPVIIFDPKLPLPNL